MFTRNVSLQDQLFADLNLSNDGVVISTEPSPSTKKIKYKQKVADLQTQMKEMSAMIYQKQPLLQFTPLPSLPAVQEEVTTAPTVGIHNMIRSLNTVSSTDNTRTQDEEEDEVSRDRVQFEEEVNKMLEKKLKADLAKEKKKSVKRVKMTDEERKEKKRKKQAEYRENKKRQKMDQTKNDDDCQFEEVAAETGEPVAKKIKKDKKFAKKKKVAKVKPITPPSVERLFLSGGAQVLPDITRLPYGELAYVQGIVSALLVSQEIRKWPPSGPY